LTGKEAVFIYLNNIYFTDAIGYPLLARNATSKFEFLPLSQAMKPFSYIDPAEAAAIAGAGNSVLFGLLIAVAFNLIISLLSTGSLEIMWTFLNVVQVLNYVPALSLFYP
jgi:hypothetical protein